MPKTVQNLPPTQEMFPDFEGLPGLITDGYTVAEWHGDPDAGGEPSEVHVLVPLEFEDLKAVVVLRLQSARALDELVGVLLRHRGNVWPQDRD